MKKETNYQLIYKSNRLVVLYFVSVLTMVLSIFVIFMIFSNWSRFAMEFDSKFSAIAWAIFMLIAGNIMFCAVLWLNGKYILRIEQADEHFVFIKTWSIFGIHKTRKYPADILNSATFYNGITKSYRTPVVIAPYSILKTSSGKKLVLDEQGTWVSTKKR